ASSRRRRIRTRRLWGSTGPTRELRSGRRRRGFITRSPPTSLHRRVAQQLFTELKPRYFMAGNPSSCGIKPHRLGRVATPVRGQSLEQGLLLVEQINFLRASPTIAEPRAVENIALQREGLGVQPDEARLFKIFRAQS